MDSPSKRVPLLVLIVFPLYAACLLWSFYRLQEINRTHLDLLYSFLPWPLSNEVAASAWVLVGVLPLFIAVSVIVAVAERRATLSPYLIHAIVLTSLAVGLVAIFVLPNQSTDFYGYVAHGRQIVHFGHSPYLHTLIELASDPIIGETRFHWVKDYSVYGPLALAIFSLPSLLGLETYESLILGQKILSLIAFGISLVLFNKLTGQLATPYRTSALFVFALNPMLIFLLLAEAHVEVFALPFILLLLLTVQHQSIPLKTSLWACCVLVKFTFFILAPLVLFEMLMRTRSEERMDRRFQLLAQAALHAVLVGGLLLIGFHFAFEGMKLFNDSNFLRRVNELQWLLCLQCMGIVPWLAYESLSSLELFVVLRRFIISMEIGRWLFFFTALWLCWRALGLKEERMQRGALTFAFCVLGLFLLGTNYVQPWYYTPMIPLGFLLFRGFDHFLWFVITATTILFSGTFMYYLHGFELGCYPAILWAMYSFLCYQRSKHPA